MALVMYDLDGTLLDTAEEIYFAVNSTLSQYGHQTVTLPQIKVLIGYGTEWLMKQAWPNKSELDLQHVWEKVMSDFVRHYAVVAGTKSQLYPKVLETLEGMKQLSIRQAVVTNKEQPFTNCILEKNGIIDFFDLIVAGNTLPVKKPDAAVVQHCLNTLGIDAKDSLFVGDSAIDIATARNANVTCWVVPYGYNGGKDIRLSNPDKLIQDLSAVSQFFS